MIIGALKPIIIIPFPYLAHFSPNELKSIFIHELIHIKRYDFIIKNIQSLITCFLYFNPTTWILNYKIEKYREYSCDDLVLIQLQKPGSYIKALYEVAQFSLGKYQKSIALFNHKSTLVMRINRMLNIKQRTNRLKPISGIGILLILISTLFAFQFHNDFETDFEEPISSFLHQELDLSPIDFRPEEPIIEIQALKDIPGSINSPVVHIQSKSTYTDTVPDKTKLKKLEKELELKTQELEELSQKMELEMELNINAEVEKTGETSPRIGTQNRTKIERNGASNGKFGSNERD